MSGAFVTTRKDQGPLIDGARLSQPNEFVSCEMVPFLDRKISTFPSALVPRRSQLDSNAILFPSALMLAWLLVQPEPAVNWVEAAPTTARKISMLPSALPPVGLQFDCQAAIVPDPSETGAALVHPLPEWSSVT